jgi:hypothetical protein
LHYVLGTESHVGDNEKKIAEKLQADIYDILTMNINGKNHVFAHHGKKRGAGQNEGNALRNFLRDYRDDLEKDEANLRHQYLVETDARGYTSGFHLNRALTDCLLTGYSAVARMRVIKRWHELEKPSLPVIQDPMLAAMVKSLVEIDAIKTEQNRQAVELARMQETIAVVEARTQPENSHFTVMGWSSLIGNNITLQEASQLGRKCAAVSKETGAMIGDIPDPRFGRVHTYHKSILERVVGPQPKPTGAPT